MSVKVFDVVKPGVVLGEDVQKLFKVARENEFAIPAVNVVGTNSLNAVLGKLFIYPAKGSVAQCW